MNNKKPKSYFEHVLAFDVETSGLFFKNVSPCNKGEEHYQVVSIGLIITDVKTFSKIIDKLYIEIQWNGKSLWNAKAEQIHGLSKSYLSANGKTEEEAAVEIANFIHKHFNTSGLKCLGHNIRSFDIPFLQALMARHEININFSNRHIDTFSMSMGTIGAFDSDDLFYTMGLKERSKHNALEDIEYTIESARRIKLLWQSKVDVCAYE